MKKILASALACLAFSFSSVGPIAMPQAHAGGDKCISMGSPEKVVTYVSNNCPATLHVEFQINGGTDYQGQACEVGKSGSYTFGPNYQHVGLLLTGCSYDIWVCGIGYWNEHGGRCH